MVYLVWFVVDKYALIAFRIEGVMNVSVCEVFAVVFLGFRPVEVECSHREVRECEK